MAFSCLLDADGKAGARTMFPKLPRRSSNLARPARTLLDSIGWYQRKWAMSNADGIPFETTLHVRDHCLCLAAQRAARVLARRFDEALRPVGLTNGQFSLLMSLNRAEAPSIGAIAALLAMDRTTL